MKPNNQSARGCQVRRHGQPPDTVRRPHTRLRGCGVNYVVTANRDGWSTQVTTLAEVDAAVDSILEDDPDEEITITVELDDNVRCLIETWADFA